jgi:hypothetical protein
MALVEIARFLDLTEAQAAASALRASGVEVFVQNENWGQVEAYLQLAMGGFRLWTPEEDAADAQAFLAEVRREAPQPAPREGSAAPAVVGLAASLALAPVLGWLVAPFTRRRLADD